MSRHRQRVKLSADILAARTAYRRAARSDPDALAAAGLEAAPGGPGGAVTAYVPALILCKPGKSLRNLAEKYHMRVSEGSGSVRPALIPIEHIDAVARDDRVLDVSLDHTLSIPDPPDPETIFAAAADSAGRAMGAPIGFDYATRVADFRKKHKLDRSADGPGPVLIGVIDTGIDGGHPAFAGRVRRVWDQREPGGASPSIFPTTRFRGVEYTGGATANATDPEWHGTSVASVAAELAPGADLVVVGAHFNAGAVADGLE